MPRTKDHVAHSYYGALPEKEKPAPANGRPGSPTTLRAQTRERDRSRDAIWQYSSLSGESPQRLDGRSVLPGSYVHVPRARYTFGASTYH